MEINVRETPCVLDITSLMSQLLSALLPGDFSSSVLRTVEMIFRMLRQLHMISFVSLFCVENYGIEAASCLAFSWVFQNEILMGIR